MSKTTLSIQEPVTMKAFLWTAILGFVCVSLLTVLFAPRLAQLYYPLPEDQGPAWYFWQTEQLAVGGRIAMWTGYALHQLLVWGIFAAARLEKGRRIRQGLQSPPVNEAFANPGPSSPGRYHWLMLGVNFLFVLLHLAQTWLWYDGLAQDVPIWTSQGSVIVMLVLLLVMEMPRRGLFWGRIRKVPESLHGLLRAWHGPFISWAIVYTFWFHPMDGNWGLMTGFLYMFMLFIQMMIFGTHAHKNRYWVALLEGFVIVHGTLVTVYKESEAWPLFFFGFLAMAVFTYVHTGSDAGRLGKLVPWFALGVYLLSAVLVYSGVRGWDNAIEMIFIPVALYGGALGLLLTGWLFDFIASRFAGRAPG